MYLAAAVLIMSACSEKQPEATPPELNTPEVKLPEEKPLKEKLSQVMRLGTLGMNIAYLEGITGPAMYISDDGTERRYKIEGCDFQVKTSKKQNHESVAAIRIQITPDCDVDIGKFIAILANDKFPTLSELTFGNVFKETGGDVLFYSDCVMDCGNAPVYGYWEAPPVLNHIRVELEAAQFSSEIIDATIKWRDYMIEHIGEEWVRQAKFNCDPYKYSSEASKLFSSVHPTAIRIGYDIEFDDSFYCKEKPLDIKSGSTTKKVDPLSEEWEKIKDQVISKPSLYVENCIDQSVNIARDLGGQSRKETLRDGSVERSCKDEVVVLTDCARRLDGADLECYKKYAATIEGD